MLHHIKNWLSKFDVMMLCSDLDFFLTPLECFSLAFVKRTYATVVCVCVCVCVYVCVLEYPTVLV